MFKNFTYKKKLVTIFLLWLNLSILLVFIYFKINKINIKISNEIKLSKSSIITKKNEVIPQNNFNKNYFEKELFIEMINNSITLNTASTNINNKVNNYSINYSSNYENSKKIILFILKKNMDIKNIEFYETNEDNIILTKIIFRKYE
jgi:hypothetical protein